MAAEKFNRYGNEYSFQSKSEKVSLKNPQKNKSML